MFLKILSFDIEVLTSLNRMPCASNIDNKILLVSCSFNYDLDINGIKTRSVSLLLGKKDRIYSGYGVSSDVSSDVSSNAYVIYMYDNEIKIINKLFEFVRNCDVVTGYNINGFDWVYIIDRCKFLGIKNIKLGNGDETLYYRSYLSKGMTVVKVGGLTGKIVFDVLYFFRREDASNVFMKKYNLKRLTLKVVSKEILGVEKLDFDISDMIKYWKNGYGYDNEITKKFIKYGRRDSEIPLEFIRKFRLLDKFIMLSKRSGKLVQEVINSQGSGLMVENIIVRANKFENRVTPCRSREDLGYMSDKNRNKLIGAEVLSPKIGISENVGLCDYLSLYPSIMIRHNLCYSTVVMDDLDRLIEEDKVVKYTIGGSSNGGSGGYGNSYGYFIKKEVCVGVIPRLLSNLLNERISIKREMKKYEKGSFNYMMSDANQEAVKILLNSFYGYCGDISSKTYNWYVASVVTANGRKQIKSTIKIINDMSVFIEKESLIKKEFKMRVVQSDTDSSYVEVYCSDGNVPSKSDVVYCVNEVVKYVNSIIEKPMELVFESYIKRMIIIAKKRYAMLVVKDDRSVVISKGLEVVRRDWCDMASEIVREVVNLILLEDNISNGIKKSIELVKESIKKLKKNMVDVEKLILTNKLTKPITSYDNKEPHVLVVDKMISRGCPSKIGDRIEYLIIDNGKDLISERAEEAQYVIDNKLKIDFNYYIYNQVIPPTLRVLELFGVSKKMLLVGLDERQTDLSRWL